MTRMNKKQANQNDEEDETRGIKAGIRKIRDVLLRKKDGTIVSVPQYVKNGFVMPVEYDYDCMFFNKGEHSCDRPKMFIKGVGCWGGICKFRVPKSDDSESTEETSYHFEGEKIIDTGDTIGEQK